MIEVQSGNVGRRGGQAATDKVVGRLIGASVEVALSIGSGVEARGDISYEEGVTIWVRGGSVGVRVGW